MSREPHTLIVGGGIAGACAALALAGRGRVTLVDGGRAGGGATGVAAGLVNPFMGPKAKPVWRHAEALGALGALLARIGAGYATAGVLRPAADARQAEAFRVRADEHADALGWLNAGALTERFPDVRAPHGGLWVRAGGAVRGIGERLRAALVAADAVEMREDVRLLGWGEASGAAWADVEGEGGRERIEADRVLLCLGAGFAQFEPLRPLGLHAVKGEVVPARVAGLRGPLPAVAAGAYAVPAGGEHVHLGGTYAHAFDSLAPTAVARADLHAKLLAVLPGLIPLPDAPGWAGARVNVPGTRLPLVGPLPGARRVWTFTGLGSKGLLMGPLLGRDVPRFFDDPEAIPPEVRIG